MKRLFSSKFERDQFVGEIQKENKQDWLYSEIKKNDNNYGNHLAWALTSLCENDNSCLQKHIDDIIDWLPKIKTQGIKRSILRSVVNLNLSEKKEGEWVDYLFELITISETDVAVKVHAMELLSNYVMKYEELANELYLIIEDGMPYFKPSLKARGRKVMKKIGKVIT